MRLLRFRLHSHFLFRTGHLLPESRALPLHLVSIDAGFSEAAEVLHGLISIILGFLKDGMRLFIGLLKDSVFFLLQPALTVMQLFFASFQLLLLTVQCLLFVFLGNPVLFQGCQYILKRFILLADSRRCVINDTVRQTEALRDGEGVAFSGHADQQTVGGAQGRDIKFTASVFYAVFGESVDF